MSRLTGILDFQPNRKGLLRHQARHFPHLSALAGVDDVNPQRPTLPAHRVAHLGHRGPYTQQLAELINDDDQCPERFQVGRDVARARS